MIAVPETVTFDTAPRVVETLARELRAGSNQLDLSGCREFDSSLIAVVLELRRRAQARRGDLVAHEAPPKLRKLAALYGAEALVFGSG